MTDQDKELRMRLSMLMDAELDAGENTRLIDAIETDAELKSVWASYCRIGDVMRTSAQGQWADVSFSSKVSSLIAQESTVLAPKRLKHLPNRRSSVVTLGLAASLAMAAVIVVKSVNEHADVFQTASYTQSGSNSVAAKSTAPVENLAESRFNDYLVMHNETAYMAGSAAMLPYVRVVSTDSKR